MTVDRDEFRESFFEECDELLEAMHDGFDRLSGQQDDEETMHAVFRAVHSIKGGAGAFGLNHLVRFAHHFETALDKVRSGKLDLDDELLDLFRQCGDNLSDLVGAAREGGDTPCPGTGTLNERLDDVLGTDGHVEDPEEPEFEPVVLDFGDFDLPGDDSGMSIRFTALPGLFKSGNDPVVLFAALEKLGTVEVTADLADIGDLDSLEPGVCAIRWTIDYSGNATEEEVREVFEFVEDLCTLEIEVKSPGLPDLDAEVPDLPADLLPSVASLDPVKADGATLDKGARPKERSGAKQDQDDRKPGGTIRVDLEKIDKLINLVGELVIKEAMLAQSIADLGPPSESEISVGFESLKALAGEIQEGVMAIRAQPVKPMFQRMARIVREAASATGKKVRFVTNGEYTEVDKTVVERLVDPLTHMIRNAVDHGLEKSEARVAAGKPAEGTVTLSAAHRSGRVMIDISDDGGGINRDRVRQIAVERGLINESDSLSPSEIENLLFLPGFSSASEVSELSGRGVGLDVVRSEIHRLGGRVSIQSDPGEGTTFSISLPLTLAVLEGMIIQVAGQTMVVPISAIQETLQPKSAAIHDIATGGRLVRNRDGLVPIIDVGEFFGFRSEPRDLDPHVLLLIESDDSHRYALVVDEIQDQRQVVIKSLETNYQQIDGIAAATILGDGRIALIIDPDNIVRGSGAKMAGDLNLQLAV